jgi:hydrogenase small subunit
MQHFGEVDGAWPIGLGHPCFGCTEQKIAFRVPLHTTIDIERPRPPDTYPPVHQPQGFVSPAAIGVAGAIAGARAGAGLVASRQLDQVPASAAAARPPKEER